MIGSRGTIAATVASTGNDLVSLRSTCPERTNLPRFYSRILTAAEQALYHQEKPNLPFDHYVWLCWSVKESVYKYKKRQFPDLLFAPLRIAIRGISHSQGSYHGIVDPAALSPADAAAPVDATTVLYSRSLIQDGVIVTTVSDDPRFAGTHWGYSAIDSSARKDQSTAVRSLVLKELGSVLSRNDLLLEKDAAGCPILLAGGQPLEIPVSLAHHDNYVAYSFLNKIA